MSAARRLATSLALTGLTAGGLTAATLAPAQAATVVATTWMDAFFAFENGNDVVLGDDIVAPEWGLLPVAPGADISLDLAGHSLTVTDPVPERAAIEVPADSTLTIGDSVTDGVANALTATGVSSAGIGGSGNQPVGTVRIEGGTVVATGGTDAAGIGSSNAGTAGNVTITGGTVTATGGDGAADIGGGQSGPGAVLTVEAGAQVHLLGARGFGAGRGHGIPGTFTNTGSVSVAGLVGPLTAEVTNAGSLAHTGPHPFDLSSALTNEAGATFTTQGSLSGNGSLVNHGTLVNTGTISITGAISNGGTLEHRGGSITTAGVFTNVGTLSTFAGSSITIGATQLINTGSITGAGTITNNGRITGAGTVANDGQGGAGTTVTKNSYRLTFDLNGAGPGAAPDRLAVFAATVGSSEQALPTPALPAGRTFMGWRTAATGGTQVTGSTSLSEALGGDGPRSATLYADYTIAQSIEFDTDPPSPARVGGSYEPAATGGESGEEVELSIHDDTTDAACSMSSSGLVSFDHVGNCVIAADQSGSGRYTAADQVTQTITVGQATQTITFTSAAPSVATVGGTPYTPTVTGGGSGNDVVLSVHDDTTNAACSISDGVVSFDHVGSCVIAANQAGDDDHTVADEVTQSFAIGQATQTIDFTSAAPSVATVGGTPYSPTATGGDSGNDVIFTIHDDTTNDACTLEEGVVTFDHAGTCVIAADQAGAGDYAPAPTVTQSFAIAAVATTTDLSVSTTALSATVTPVTGKAVATGTVTFTVGGTTVGTAPLTNGVATLTHTVPTGAARTITATYAGTADFTTSTKTATRNDPTITATRSAEPNKHGWYAAPVSISFACTPTTAALTAHCPAPVTLTESRASQTATGTVTAADGGAATASVSGINIDRTAPTVRVTGVKKGKTYTGKAPKPRCVGTDTLSGVDRCTLTKKTKKLKKGKGKRITYTATAYDKAGNKRTTKGSYTLKRGR